MLEIKCKEYWMQGKRLVSALQMVGNPLEWIIWSSSDLMHWIIQKTIENLVCDEGYVNISLERFVW